MKETDSILRELDRFESERLAYNEKVQRFNDSLDRYESEAKAYNERVGQYNDQLRRGLPEDERIEVGDPPVEPARPQSLTLPDRLRELSRESQRIDLVALVEKRALEALINDRPAHLIDARMREKFAGIGIEITYRP